MSTRFSSSSLRIVQTDFGTSRKGSKALMFYTMFVSRGGSAEAIMFKGILSESLLLVLASLTNLKSLQVIDPDPSRYDDFEVCFAPLPQLVKQLPSLRSLHLRLGYRRVEPWLGGHVPLEHLHLTGTADSLKSFVSYNKSHFLGSLLLKVDSDDTHDLWRCLCETTATNFPFLKSFTLETVKESDGTPLVMNDLAPLFSLPLSAFALKYVPHGLNMPDIVKLSRSWPDLREFTFVSDEAPFDSAILLPLSQLHKLRSLTIRVSLKRIGILFEVDQFCQPTLPQSQSLLEELIIVDPELSLPSTVQERFDLVDALLKLFPKLLTISSNREFGSQKRNNYSDSKFVSDQDHSMQEIITTHKVIVSREAARQNSATCVAV